MVRMGLSVFCVAIAYATLSSSTNLCHFFSAVFSGIELRESLTIARFKTNFASLSLVLYKDVIL